MVIGLQRVSWIYLKACNRKILISKTARFLAAPLLILFAMTAPVLAEGYVSQTFVKTGYWATWGSNYVNPYIYISAEAACKSTENLYMANYGWWHGVYIGTEHNADYYVSRGALNCIFQDSVTGVISPQGTVIPGTHGDCPANSKFNAGNRACACDTNFKPDPTVTSCVPVVTCPIDKVADITDPVAQQYEDGIYSDKNPDIDHLTSATQSGLACIQQKVAALNCYMTPQPTSGYRPTAYQKHLLEVYDQWQKIKSNNTAACADTKAAIKKEFDKHSTFARRPGVTSKHSQLDAQGIPAGTAVDISPVPDDANISADAIACQCNMYRPLINMPNPKDNDPVHYQPRTCLP